VNIGGETNLLSTLMHVRMECAVNLVLMGLQLRKYIELRENWSELWLHTTGEVWYLRLLYWVHWFTSAFVVLGLISPVPF